MNQGWAPLLQTAIGAIAVLSGTMLATWLQGRSEYRRWRRDQVRQVLSETLRALSSSLVVPVGTDMARFEEWFRTLGTLRENVVVLQVYCGAPSDEFKAAIQAFLRAIEDNDFLVLASEGQALRETYGKKTDSSVLMGVALIRRTVRSLMAEVTKEAARTLGSLIVVEEARRRDGPRDDQGDALQNSRPEGEVRAASNTEQMRIHRWMHFASTSEANSLTVGSESATEPRVGPTYAHDAEKHEPHESLPSSSGTVAHTGAAPSRVLSISGLTQEARDAAGEALDRPEGAGPAPKMPNAGTVEINAQNFKDVLERDGIVLIDWWAPWCGPCRVFGPTFEKVAQKHPDIAFGKVNIDDQPDLAQAFNIRSTPTLTILRNKVLVFSQPGALPEPALEDLLKQVRAPDMEQVRRDRRPGGVPGQ